MFLGPVLRGLTALLTLATQLPAVVEAAYPNPIACKGACWAHDPGVVKRASDGKYFRFGTGSKIGIWTASSLTGSWTYQGAALPGGSSINLAGNDDLWAPSVHLVGSTYYMYYTVSVFGSQNSAIGYATSTTMEVGSWKDHGTTGISSSAGKPYNAIDGALIQAADGNNYVTFGSFWSGIYVAQMKKPPTVVAASATQIAYNATGDHAMEGPFIYYRAPYYYLFFSAGICCGYQTTKPAPGEEYSIRVCRSSSPTGPYTDASGKACKSGGGTKVLESHGNVYGPAGQGILVDTAYDGAVMYYHYADTRVGLADSQYLFGFNKISWSTGWPVLV
ncbi:endo-alpha-1,5-arabinanase [Diaporthe helianthi]|uniref:Arabinan endo-1,5-alpha-L-arabinosidase n=1 Tax=Diaporthe helianthi TaxID=158607 RepID=A0A2P5HV98_DIAHE|nr:endo-alpha-1,5-arabinanase [Diaporthe helianthi]